LRASSPCLEQAGYADLAIGIDPAAQAIRAMIETVTVTPGVEPEIIVQDDLGRVLGFDAFGDGLRLGGRLVAEDGFEPPTHGL
jgi:hypothetical protein